MVKRFFAPIDNFWHDHYRGNPEFPIIWASHACSQGAVLSGPEFPLRCVAGFTAHYEVVEIRATAQRERLVVVDADLFHVERQTAKFAVPDPVAFRGLYPLGSLTKIVAFEPLSEFVLGEEQSNYRSWQLRVPASLPHQLQLPAVQAAVESGCFLVEGHGLPSVERFRSARITRVSSCCSIRPIRSILLVGS